MDITKPIEINQNWLYIYGWSDDLIEFYGCLRDELDKYKGDVTFNLDDGSVIRIYRDKGWQASILKYGTNDIDIIKGARIFEDGEIDVISGDLVIVKGTIKEIWYKEFIR